MAIRELDELDGRSRYVLQEGARHTASSDIASVLDVSASTVRNGYDGSKRTT